MTFTVTTDGFVITQRPSRLPGYWPEWFLLLWVVVGLPRRPWSTIGFTIVFVLVLAVWRRVRVEADADGIRSRILRNRFTAWSDIHEIVIDWSRNTLRIQTADDTFAIPVRLPADVADRRHVQATFARHVDQVRNVPSTWTPPWPRSRPDLRHDEDPDQR